MQNTRQNTFFIDAGNSRMKAAAKQHGQWKLIGTWSYEDPVLKTALPELSRAFDRIVLSSVKKTLQASDVQNLLAVCGITDVEVSGIQRDSLPSNRIGYRTPETLGVDRFLACLGAWSLDKREKEANREEEEHKRGQREPAGPSPVIVTDAGTACTIDVMDADGVFRGGVIMPGLQMLTKALGEGADGLFHVDAGLPADWPPDSTEAALQAGIAGSYLAAWESHVELSLGRYPGSRLWLTGGDAAFLLNHTKRTCRRDEFLVFEGMLEWMNLSEET